jgi:hypothetical protein
VRIALALASLLVATGARAELYYVIVSGLGGDPTYEEAFATQARSLAEAATRTLGDDARVTLLTGKEASRETLRARLDELAGTLGEADRLAVFLVGHGSFDGAQYKFNLPGPDIEGDELFGLLAAVPTPNQLIVNATSASGAVLEDWAVDGRMVITATRSGAERNATRFAEHWAAALSADDADVNKNGIITAQEAFEYAERAVADSYETEGTLATEHPQLAGENAGSFDVARLQARVAASPEIEAMHERLASLEEQIADLRLRREELGDSYLDELQTLLVQVALVQEEIDAAQAE